jgi:carbon storage regulator CsrA
MLVLTRKINECILINSTIEVRVLRTHKNKVTIGLSAPHDVPICRGELQSQITLDLKELAHAAHN